MTRALVVGLVVVLSACPRARGGEGRSLEGLTLPLTDEPLVRFAVDGALLDRKALVLFDVGSPLSLVSPGCFVEQPSTRGVVTLRLPTGETVQRDEVSVPQLSLGAARLAPFVAALQGPTERCEVALGTDVLAPFALSLDVAARTLSFSSSQSAQAWAQRAVDDGSGRETHLLRLEREPRLDWPLLAVRLRQGRAQLTGPFVLSTREAHTRVSAQAAANSGLLPGLARFEGAPLPKGLQLPASLRELKVLYVEAAQLSPSLGVEQLAVEPSAPWPSRELVGVLGGDVWGRFDVTVDFAAGVLLLQRPQLLVSGEHASCEARGLRGDDACFRLGSRRDGKGLLASLAVWRPLPAGATVHLELLDGAGKPLVAPSCRIGFSLPPSDRGVSVQQRWPWPGLERALPSCLAALEAAQGLTLSLVEDERLKSCPALCGFVQDLGSGATLCACAPGANGVLPSDGQRYLELFRLLLQLEQAPPELEEPKDPPP